MARKSLRGLAAVCAAAATALTMTIGGTAAAAEELPVPPTFFSGIGPELAYPGGDLPGVNDWDCVPSAEHPHPVILVHGTGGGAQTNWGPMAPALKNEGYCVFALTYGAIPDAPWPVSAVGGMAAMEDSAAQLAMFTDSVLAATGAEKVDLVGHSQGTLMPNYYVQNLGGHEKVGTYVSLAPLWNGTDAGGASAITEFMQAQAADNPALQAYVDLIAEYCGACFQMSTGADFIERMRARPRGLFVDEVRYVNIVTRYDELIAPYTSGLGEGPNVTNVVVQDECEEDLSEHLSVAASPRAQRYVLNALDPDDAVPVGCEFVAPIFG